MTTEKKDVINFAIPVSVDGVHYEGFTVRDGVVLSVVPSECKFVNEETGEFVQGFVIKFANAKKAPQNVPYTGQREVSKVPNAKYFQVKPL